MEENTLKKVLKGLKLNEQTISKVLGVLVIIVIGALIVNYFRGINQGELENGNGVNEQQNGEVKIIEEGGKLYAEGLPTVHQVAKGENLWKIAEKYYSSGYNWVSVAKENNLVNPNRLSVGQKLNIPKSEIIKPPSKPTDTIFGQAITTDSHKVIKGDHLWGIAVRAYGDGYQWVKIAQANKLLDPNIINPGQVLILPR